MTAAFEPWIMRGLVLVLGTVLLRMVFERWHSQDKRQEDFNQALDAHRESTEAALKEFRTEFMAHLDRLRGSNETALAALNQTMAEVARTAGEIRARMAERYATKEDLHALEVRIREQFSSCKESCPPGCGN